MSDAQATGGSIKNLGWRVTFAGLGINLALGVLYTWSVIASGVDARLTVKSGPDKKTSVAIGADPVSVGRSDGKGVFKLTDGAVAQKHITVAYDRSVSAYKLSVAEGAGAVTVSDKAVTGPAVLAEGDTIKLGTTVLGFKNGWGWTQSDKAWPYSIACLIFCLIMVPAGRMQDKLSPRLVASIGGVLVGVGMILAALIGMSAPGSSLIGFIVGFGVLAGAGIGFGYAAATPPAVKWFPKAKTGLIAGLVVSGFGLASVYAAPLATKLTELYGLTTMVMAFGVGFLIVVCVLAQLLKAPPAGFVPSGAVAAAPPAADGTVKKEDFRPSEMLKTWQFYLLWFMYACGAGAGLMVISVTKKLGAGKTIGAFGAGTIMVVTLAIGNGAGRIMAGMLSDKLGRKATMAIFFVFQAVMVMLLALSGSVSALGTGVMLAIVAALVGANYGSNLALFPSATKDFYGLKNFGMNYGLVFTAWGVGGFMLAKFAGWVYDGKILETWKGSFNFAYYTSAALLVLAALLTIVVRAPRHTEQAS